MAVEFDILIYDHKSHFTRIRMDRDLEISAPDVDMAWDDMIGAMSGQETVARQALGRVEHAPLEYLLRNASFQNAKSADRHVVNWAMDCIDHVVGHLAGSALEGLDDCVRLVMEGSGEFRKIPLDRRGEHERIRDQVAERLSEKVSEVGDNLWDEPAEALVVFTDAVTSLFGVVRGFCASPSLYHLRVEGVVGVHFGVPRLIIDMVELLFSLTGEPLMDRVWMGKEIRPYTEGVDPESARTEFRERWIRAETMWVYNRVFDYIEGLVKV